MAIITAIAATATIAGIHIIATTATTGITGTMPGIITVGTIEARIRSAWLAVEFGND